MIQASILLLSALVSSLKFRREWVLENFALRQQLAIYKKRCHPRPSLQPTDRLFWVWLAKIWTGWRSALLVVKPETVIGWHRKGFGCGSFRTTAVSFVFN